MDQIFIPELRFPTVKFGARETHWDLTPLLYPGWVSNSPAALKKTLQRKVCPERLRLLVKVHEEVNGCLVGGGSRYTAIQDIRLLRNFFAWADANNHRLNIETLENIYGAWCDFLIQRYRLGEISDEWAYSSASRIGRVFDRVLGRSVSLISETRINPIRGRHSRLRRSLDKQDLEKAFRFGHLLYDIASALTKSEVFSHLPIRISLRSGETLEEWLGLFPPNKLVTLRSQREEHEREERRAARANDTSFRVRHPIINLRIEAELMIFLSQTGMNLAQAHSLKNDRFHYTSHIDGYFVRRYKERRSGEVEFEIFSEYKAIFEAYLIWRDTIFPEDNDGLLFPFIKTQGRSDDAPPTLHRLKSICDKLDITFIGPRELRSTRVNWLLRRSNDVELTAEMAQHTKETLLSVYERPSLQVAMIEIAKFHAQTDPTISPPGPGLCVSPNPVTLPTLPKHAPKPDCVNPAGCLFCQHQRDLDKLDHVWSLASFRYLKSIELVKSRHIDTENAFSSDQPAGVTVKRLTDKLQYFEKSNRVREHWVQEALARVQEEDYHPAWDGFIRLQESQR